MNAIEILQEHLRLLLTVYGPLASGAGYLQGLIDARVSTNNIELTDGVTSMLQPKTIAGYKYSASRIFGDDSPAVAHLVELEAEHGPDFQIVMDELLVAYRLGLLVAKRDSLPIVE